MFAVVDVYGAVEAVTISSSALVESFTSLLSLADEIITSDRIIQVPFFSFLLIFLLSRGFIGVWGWTRLKACCRITWGKGWKWTSFGSLSFTLPKCAQPQLGDNFQLMSLVDAPDLAQHQVGDHFQLMSLVDAPDLAKHQLGDNFQLMSLVDAPNLAQNQGGDHFQLMNLVDAPDLAQHQVGDHFQLMNLVDAPNAPSPSWEIIFNWWALLTPQMRPAPAGR